MSDRQIGFAYGSIPKDGGTFTFYRSLRPHLEAAGIRTFCVSVGTQQAGLWDSAFEDAGCHMVAVTERSLRSQAMHFASWCRDMDVRVVMPVNSTPILAALPHLPASIRIVARCADSKDFGYRRVLASRERLSRIVATTPRHVRDLTERYHVDPQLLALIPHGVEPDAFSGPAHQPRGHEEELRLGFLGRLEHRQKGVFFLPPLLDRLVSRGVKCSLSIAGRGYHQDELTVRLKQHVRAGRVRFVGHLTREEIPGFLGGIDVFLFPSQHEGFGFSLIEAMMAGCAVVSSRLEGVTDFILESGRSGLLADVGDVAAMVAHIEDLARDRGRLATLGAAARDVAVERFSARVMAQAYAAVIREVVEGSATSTLPRPWDEFRGVYWEHERSLSRRVLGKVLSPALTKLQRILRVH